MAQISFPSTDITTDLDGSDTFNTGWSWAPFGSASSFAEALSTIGGAAAILNFTASGTVFANIFCTMQPLLPPTAGTHTIYVRQDTAIDGDIELYNISDSSTIAMFGMVPTGIDAYTDQDYVLSSGEIAAIIDYSNIGVRVYQADDGGITFNESRIDYVAFEIPDAAMIDLVPDGDIVTTGWAPAPLWSKVDELSADGTVITGTAS